jgi:hypothetical protein
MKRPLIGKKDFQTSINKDNKFKEGSWEAYQKREWYLVCFFQGKRRRMSV